MKNNWPTKKLGRTKQNKIPRIIYLKMFFGDDYIDYIKDDYGLEKFLKEKLESGRKIKFAKRNFFETTETVKDFAVQWLIFTDYYKDRFGQGVRDKDATKRLAKEKRFKNITKLYKFRCQLFKSDFSVNKDFLAKLSKWVFYIKKLNMLNFKDAEARDRYLLKSKEW